MLVSVRIYKYVSMRVHHTGTHVHLCVCENSGVPRWVLSECVPVEVCEHMCTERS